MIAILGLRYCHVGAAGRCWVDLTVRKQPASAGLEDFSGRQGWAPEWLSTLAADERLVRYNMEEAPLMRAILVQQVRHP